MGPRLCPNVSACLVGLALTLQSSSTAAWAPASRRFRLRPLGASRPRNINARINSNVGSQGSVVDADFERVPSSSTEEKPTPKKAEPFSPAMAQAMAAYMELESSKKNLIDWSLESEDQVSIQDGDGNPVRLSEVRVPFVDPTDNECIDARLAFTVNCEGTMYGIGVPYDHAVAVFLEDFKTDTVEYLSADDENNEELFNIMATHVAKHLGDEKPEEKELDLENPDALLERASNKDSENKDLVELKLHKTPRVLTISGNLDAITDGWEARVSLEPITPEEFKAVATEDLNFESILSGKSKQKKTSTNTDSLEDDPAMADFLKIMRQDLGDDEVDKIMGCDNPFVDLVDENDPSSMLNDPNIMELFNVPGVGTMADDKEAFQELIDSIQEDMTKVKNGETLENDFGEKDYGKPKVLKLISFLMNEGKTKYSLAKLLEPYPLVGRYVGPLDEVCSEDDFYFELLSREESAIVIPKLEKMCQQDLKRAGLSLAP